MTGRASSETLYAAITAQIADAIEKGAAQFQMPWHRASGQVSRPWNAASARRYQGINVVSLWLQAEARAYPHPIWATYKQWQDLGAQVRRGERSALIVFYKTLEREEQDPATGEDVTQRIPLARASHVFNVAQVDNFEPPAIETPPQAAEVAPLEAADHVARCSGADIREGGDRAYYNPSIDFVAMPDRGRFVRTATMDATESYYATLLHELTHWTGGAKRLARNLSARFGENAYAMEELIAELGASYLCADLGVTTALRPDHAAYIQSWLKVMRSDARAVFTAAARAQQAATYLMQFAPAALQPKEEGGDDDEAPAPPRRTGGQGAAPR